MRKVTVVEWILRVGVFGTFIGHGILAFSVKAKWIPYLVTVGFSIEQAQAIMPFIGVLDIIVAVWILLKPNKYIILWAFTWALATATIRPLSGEPFLEFVERSANWAVPLALFWFRYKKN